MINVAVLNQSTRVSDLTASQVTTGLQNQVTQDFEPAWGIGAKLIFVPKGVTPPACTWQLVLLDDTTQMGALGYHQTTSEGQPIGFVFIKTASQNGIAWSTVASHELLEMLADPDINLEVEGPPVSGDVVTIYAYEIADMVEATSYPKGSVLVSNFNYPANFEPAGTKAVQLDHLKLVTQSFQLLPGGYIGIRDVTAAGGWTQLTAERAKFSYAENTRNKKYHFQIGSRAERRNRPKEQWKKSLQ